VPLGDPRGGAFRYGNVLSKYDESTYAPSVNGSVPDGAYRRRVVLPTSAAALAGVSWTVVRLL
jgi:hypothetical protein